MAQLRFSTTPHSRFPVPATSTAVIRFSGRHGYVHFLPDSALDSVHPAVGISLNLSPPLRIRVRTLVRTTTGDGAGITVGGGGGSGSGRRNGGGGGGGGGAGHSGAEGNGKSDTSGGILGLFLEGWRSRVRADPQFPFKVLMEELVGVSANVIGDMATRPNFGLNELDFVFSTLVVGSIVNFLLMYLLAPTTGAVSASAASNPFASIFAACPKSHMFEPGPYSLLHRSGTFICKGVVFAAVGFAAGMLGTAISNALISWRKRMDPGFERQNKAPPTVLNALTWAIHLGVSSNLRYQTLMDWSSCLPKLCLRWGSGGQWSRSGARTTCWVGPLSWFLPVGLGPRRWRRRRQRSWRCFRIILMARPTWITGSARLIKAVGFSFRL